MILMTGSTGFIGHALLKYITQHTRLPIRTYGRSSNTLQDVPHVFGELDESIDYLPALSDVDVIIHTAARVHVMKETAVESLAAYRKVNVAATFKLAKQAADAGVKRFIFISSIKVNGESTLANASFNYADQAIPEDPYGVSKAEAEYGLWQIAKASGMELVVIRPPLVYGPGVRANFSSIMRIVSKNIPLPFGAINNKRSMVALDNLISLIVTCLDHPNAANQTFLVSDDQDVSTTELFHKMAHAFGKKARLVPIPMSWIYFVAMIFGKKMIADRLCGSLQVDISHTKETLGWKPPVTMEQQLSSIAASMLSSRDI